MMKARYQHALSNPGLRLSATLQSTIVNYPGGGGAESDIPEIALGGVHGQAERQERMPRQMKVKERPKSVSTHQVRGKSLHNSKGSTEKLPWTHAHSLATLDNGAPTQKPKIDPRYKGYSFGQSKEKLEAQVLLTHPRTDKRNPGPGHYSPRHCAAHSSLTKEFTMLPKRSESSVFAVSSEAVSRPGPGTYDYSGGSFANSVALKRLLNDQVRSATKFVNFNNP